MSESRYDRTLLLDPDPDATGERKPLESLKDATWEHQAYAAAHGYNSLVAMAVDELVTIVRDLVGRMDILEAQIHSLQRPVGGTYRHPVIEDAIEDAETKWPARPEMER